MRCRLLCVFSLAVDVVEAETFNPQRSFPVRSAVTDDIGRVEIGELRPGRYLVGINLTRAPDIRQPYPRTFYPGVSESGTARVIQLALGELVNLEKLVLPPPLPAQTIRGVVKSPDGKPVAKAAVALWMPVVRQVGSGIATDGEGRLEFKAHAGQRCYLTAFINIAAKPAVQWTGRSAEFEASADLAPVTITLQPPRDRR